MKLDSQTRQLSARDRERLELDLSEMPAKVSDTTHLHQPKPRRFSERFLTFFWTGVIASIVVLIIDKLHVTKGWPW